MNYLTTYYKNLCEDLQAKIDLREESAKSLQATRRFGPTSKEAVIPAFKSEIARGKAERVMKNIIDIDQQLDAEAPEVRKESSKKYVTQANLEKSGLAGPDENDEMHVTPSQY
jgi:hypothetical protein